MASIIQLFNNPLEEKPRKDGNRQKGNSGPTKIWYCWGRKNNVRKSTHLGKTFVQHPLARKAKYQGATLLVGLGMFMKYAYYKSDHIRSQKLRATISGGTILAATIMISLMTTQCRKLQLRIPVPKNLKIQYYNRYEKEIATVYLVQKTKDNSSTESNK